MGDNQLLDIRGFFTFQTDLSASKRIIDDEDIDRVTHIFESMLYNCYFWPLKNCCSISLMLDPSSPSAMTAGGLDYQTELPPVKVPLRPQA